MKQTKQWSWKTWLNGVVIIPEDTTELIKYATALIAAIFAKFGYTELGQIELLVIGLVIKAILDRVHFWLKHE